MGPVDLSRNEWKTLETVWGQVPSIEHVFRQPPGVNLRVRYGAGWFSWSRQEKTTDGQSDKKLSVNGFVARAKFQARSSKPVQLTWRRIP